MGVFPQRCIKCERYLSEDRRAETRGNEAEPVWRNPGRADYQGQVFHLRNIPGNASTQWSQFKLECQPHALSSYGRPQRGRDRQSCVSGVKQWEKLDTLQRRSERRLEWLKHKPSCVESSEPEDSKWH